MGLPLGSIPLGQRGLPGWGGLCLQHQLQFGQIHGKCSRVGGACQVQHVEFRRWSLPHKHPDAPACRFHISQCG